MKEGNPVTRNLWPSHVRPNPVLEKSDRLLLNWNRSNPSMAWAPDNPDASLRMPDGKSVDLAPKAKVFLDKRTAVLARQSLESSIDALQIARPTEDDFKAVKRAYEDARSQARDELRRLLPSIRP